MEFYFVASSGRKSVCTLVRQLRGPHVERAMCLAYYLAHYKDIPSLKTADITKLNTEAAQRKFANTAYTINNGATTGTSLLLEAAGTSS